MPAPFYHGSPPPKGPESLSGHVRDLANAFSNAAGVLSDQYNTLNKATDGLLDGTNLWEGQGASSFSTAWQTFGAYMQQMQKACEDTYNALNKFANKLSDVEAQQVWDILLTIVGGILTLISVAAAIAEFGLNPFVDGIATFFSGFTEQEGSSVVNAAEEITQADSQAATELQAVEDELTTSPTLSGPSNVTDGGTIDPVSPGNIDEMTDLSDINEDDSTLYAKGNSSRFNNPINMSTESTEANMPPGVNNPTGKYWIQEIKNSGVRVEWNRSVQVDLEGQGLGFTDNKNFDPENGTPDYVVVGLGPDATNATVYEEYLHVQEAQARGWMPPPDPPVGRLSEEIQVEYQVLEKAQDLDMPSDEFDQLGQIRQGYIDQLKQVYAQRGLPWPPADLTPYLQDPPKPGNLP